MKFYAIKRYQRDTTERSNELLDVYIVALFTTHDQANTYLHLTPRRIDLEMEIQEIQVSGSIDLGGLEVVRD